MSDVIGLSLFRFIVLSTINVPPPRNFGIYTFSLHNKSLWSHDWDPREERKGVRFADLSTYKHLSESVFT